MSWSSSQCNDDEREAKAMKNKRMMLGLTNIYDSQFISENDPLAGKRFKKLDKNEIAQKGWNAVTAFRPLYVPHGGIGACLSMYSLEDPNTNKIYFAVRRINPTQDPDDMEKNPVELYAVDAEDKEIAHLREMVYYLGESEEYKAIDPEITEAQPDVSISSSAVNKEVKLRDKINGRVALMKLFYVDDKPAQSEIVFMTRNDFIKSPQKDIVLARNYLFKQFKEVFWAYFSPHNQVVSASE